MATTTISFLVEPGDSLADQSPGILLGFASATVTSGLTPLSIADRRFEGRGERLDVARWHEQTVNAVVDDVTVARDPGRDDRENP